MLELLGRLGGSGGIAPAGILAGLSAAFWACALKGTVPSAVSTSNGNPQAATGDTLLRLRRLRHGVIGDMMCCLDARTGLTSASDDLQIGTSRSCGPNGGGRTPHPLPYLGRIHAELGERSAQRIPVHAEFFCRFALVAAMTRKNLEDVLSLKLAHRVGITDTSGVHLEDEVVEFAFQSRGLPFSELA